MDPQIERSQALQQARADHVQLALGIWNFRRLFKGASPADATQQFAEIQMFITDRIVPHFSDEELRIFPVLLAANPTAEETRIITELIEEHIILQAEIQQLHGLLDKMTLTKCKGELWSLLRNFFAILEKHVAKEDRLFQTFTAN